MRVTLKEAVKFHGHLGPYLVLGLKAGELALKKLESKKYFGLQVKVWGADKKPKSCLVDGLQLSTGATFGKGNIEKLNGHDIKMEFYGTKNFRKIRFILKDIVVIQLAEAKTHADSEILAKRLFRKKYSELFNITKIN